ncbi:MAG: hypothetical protein PHV30_11485 [Candidatus Margulisbacteria bacterium]|nr:hypothetical protein [Candidatus Margulisiibacteriota bacterium]
MSWEVSNNNLNIQGDFTKLTGDDLADEIKVAGVGTDGTVQRVIFKSDNDGDSNTTVGDGENETLYGWVDGDKLYIDRDNDKQLDSQDVVYTVSGLTGNAESGSINLDTIVGTTTNTSLSGVTLQEYIADRLKDVSINDLLNTAGMTAAKIADLFNDFDRIADSKNGQDTTPQISITGSVMKIKYGLNGTSMKVDLSALTADQMDMLAGGIAQHAKLNGYSDGLARYIHEQIESSGKMSDSSYIALQKDLVSHLTIQGDYCTAAGILNHFVNEDFVKNLLDDCIAHGAESNIAVLIHSDPISNDAINQILTTTKSYKGDDTFYNLIKNISTRMGVSTLANIISQHANAANKANILQSLVDKFPASTELTESVLLEGTYFSAADRETLLLKLKDAGKLDDMISHMGVNNTVALINTSGFTDNSINYVASVMADALGANAYHVITNVGTTRVATLLDKISSANLESIINTIDDNKKISVIMDWINTGIQCGLRIKTSSELSGALSSTNSSSVFSTLARKILDAAGTKGAQLAKLLVVQQLLSNTVMDAIGDYSKLDSDTLALLMARDEATFTSYIKTKTGLDLSGAGLDTWLNDNGLSAMKSDIQSFMHFELSYDTRLDIATNLYQKLSDQGLSADAIGEYMSKMLDKLMTYIDDNSDATKKRYASDAIDLLVNKSVCRISGGKEIQEYVLANYYKSHGGATGGAEAILKLSQEVHADFRAELFERLANTLNATELTDLLSKIGTRLHWSELNNIFSSILSNTNNVNIKDVVCNLSAEVLANFINRECFNYSHQIMNALAQYGDAKLCADTLYLVGTQAGRGYFMDKLADNNKLDEVFSNLGTQKVLDLFDRGFSGVTLAKVFGAISSSTSSLTDQQLADILVNQNSTNGNNLHCSYKDAFIAKLADSGRLDDVLKKVAVTDPEGVYSPNVFGVAFLINSGISDASIQKVSAQLVNVFDGTSLSSLVNKLSADNNLDNVVNALIANAPNLDQVIALLNKGLTPAAIDKIYANLSISSYTNAQKAEFLLKLTDPTAQTAIWNNFHIDSSFFSELSGTKLLELFDHFNGSAGGDGFRSMLLDNMGSMSNEKLTQLLSSNNAGFMSWIGTNIQNGNVDIASRIIRWCLDNPGSSLSQKIVNSLINAVDRSKPDSDEDDAIYSSIWKGANNAQSEGNTSALNNYFDLMKLVFAGCTNIGPSLLNDWKSMGYTD